MTPEVWRKLNAILDEAVARDPEERSSLLDEACGGDSDLRREVEELLALEGEAEAFLERPAFDLEAVLEAPHEAPRAGRRVGPYETVELLEEGGMGTVYLAVRVDDFEQRVALKLLPRFCARGEALRRFHLERQIQARLEHPNISRLLDGGTTEDGQPYFAMEYVDGWPIDVYCERRTLSIRERLTLFVKVCDAVHFAHQQLVVHRDLKPMNILVDAHGEPKLLDFGIAKLLRPKTVAERIETQPGSSPMTLLYASPEQVRDEPVSTASDVYSLGVLLYKLLTGCLPDGLESCGFAEAMRRICEQAPQSPSRAVRSSNEGAGRPPERRLWRRLRGDVDAIVLKALRKDPDERYGSAEQFAEDVRRHLDARPVAARRVSAFYAGGKFLQRHPWPVATVAVVLVAVLGFAGWEWRRLKKESDRAESVTNFLEELFYVATPDMRQGDRLTVEHMLAHGRSQLEFLSGEPDLYASLAETLGRIHFRLGHYEEAGELMASSLELWRRHYGAPSPELARRLGNLGAVYYGIGAYGQAEEMFHQALEVRRRLHQKGTELVRAQNNLAATLVVRGAFSEAETLYRQGLAIRRGTGTPESSAVASSLRLLGSVLSHQGRLAEAEAPLREALTMYRANHGERHTRVAEALHTLGRQRLAAGDRNEADELMREALAMRRKLLGDDHVEVARSRQQLAAVLMAGGESPDTVAVLTRQALQTYYRVKPFKDWEVAEAEILLGAYLASVGRRAEAWPCLLRGVESLEASLGPEAFVTRQARLRLVAVEDMDQGRSSSTLTARR